MGVVPLNFILTFKFNHTQILAGFGSKFIVSVIPAFLVILVDLDMKPLQETFVIQILLLRLICWHGLIVLLRWMMLYKFVSVKHGKTSVSCLGASRVSHVDFLVEASVWVCVSWMYSPYAILKSYHFTSLSWMFPVEEFGGLVLCWMRLNCMTKNGRCVNLPTGR